MTDWLDPVRAALDARSKPFDLFVRDDDGGWDDDALVALLDTCAMTGTVVDVAVIPDALDDDLAVSLSERAAAGVARVHQHGRAHTNHEPEGRRCEFGASRSYAQQLDDIGAGQARLRDAFGARLDSVFTPPWNRCVEATADALVACEIAVLSRDVSAVPFGRADLTEIPVTVDWMAKRDAAWTPSQLGARLAAGLDRTDTVGVMLHHAVTDADERDRIAEFLGLVRPWARPTTIARLADR